MTSFESGTLAGAGCFRCEQCGFAVALHEGDELPPCPSCDAHGFRRSPLFDATSAVPAPRVEEAEPGWLVDARAALVRDGDYLILESDGRVRVVGLERGWTRIGRSLAAQVRLDDPTVSRRHALLHCDAGGCKLLDDRSLNGVFRNGEPVEEVRLSDGDAISIGRFTLHFVRLAQARATAPATA